MAEVFLTDAEIRLIVKSLEAYNVGMSDPAITALKESAVSKVINCRVHDRFYNSLCGSFSRYTPEENKELVVTSLTADDIPCIQFARCPDTLPLDQYVPTLSRATSFTKTFGVVSNDRFVISSSQSGTVMSSTILSDYEMELLAAFYQFQARKIRGLV